MVGGKGSVVSDIRIFDLGIIFFELNIILYGLVEWLLFEIRINMGYMLYIIFLNLYLLNFL